MIWRPEYLHLLFAISSECDNAIAVPTVVVYVALPVLLVGDNDATERRAKERRSSYTEHQLVSFIAAQRTVEQIFLGLTV